MVCTRAREIDLAAFAVDPRAPAWTGFRDHYPRCPECAREVARYAELKQALAAEAAGPSAHPSESELLALATPSSQLASEARVRLEAHVAACAPCRTELAVARGFDFAPVSATPRRSRWLDWLAGVLAPPLWRPLLVAAGVVALAVPAAVLVWRSAQETREPPSPRTAQVEPRAPDAGLAQKAPEVPAAVETPPEPPSVAEARPPVPESSVAVQEESPAAPPPAARPQPTRIAKQPPVAEEPPAGEAPEAHPAAEPRPLEIAALLPAESPLYAPGPLASGPSVRIEGVARSVAGGGPVPEALGPAHVGLSSQESPNLYWFLPEATALPVEVTVVDPDAAAPLLETTLPGPLAAGVHRVSLAEHGVRLEPGVDYRWFAAVVPDPERRSRDLVSGAAIRFRPPGPELSARLASAPPERRAHVYAESGFWYDAFDQLSSWLATEPGAALLHQHRAALLEQVGLADAAAFERRSPAEAETG